MYTSTALYMAASLTGCSKWLAGRSYSALYAPGVRSLGGLAAIVRAVAPKPVNVLVSGDFTTVAQLAEIGVRRISVGGALARAAWTGFLAAAKEIAGQGTFTALGRTISGPELNGLFDTTGRHDAC